jgi:hypothetical protein
MVIIVERRGREGDVDAVIKSREKRFRQAPEKPKNSKSGLPQACVKRQENAPFLRFAVLAHSGRDDRVALRLSTRPCSATR